MNCKISLDRQTDTQTDRQKDRQTNTRGIIMLMNINEIYNGGVAVKEMAKYMRQKRGGNIDSNIKYPYILPIMWRTAW